MQIRDDTELFGDPADFAIEVGLAPGLRRPSAIWGRMCVWCCGQRLGNIDDHGCALFSAYKSFDWMSGHVDDLWEDALNGLDDLATWNFLDGKLYGYHGDIEIDDQRTDNQIYFDSRRFGKFTFLTNWGEQFDGYKSFLIALPSKSLRVLSRAFANPPGLGVNISRAGFVQAAQAFVEWFQSQERRLYGTT